jgi:UDP-glucose 4-epimerase
VLAGGVAKFTLPRRLAHAVAAWTWDLWRRGVPVEARAYAIHPWVIAPDRLKAAGWTPHYSSEEALVATDLRVHWDDLPPGRRQNYNLLLVIGATLGLGGAVVGALVAWRARRRRAGR